MLDNDTKMYSNDGLPASHKNSPDVIDLTVDDSLTSLWNAAMPGPQAGSFVRITTSRKRMWQCSISQELARPLSDDIKNSVWV